MSTSPAAVQAQADNQRFWNGIARLPQEAQQSFWDAGQALSTYIGENPKPLALTYDTSTPPPSAPWWERALFYIGQSQHNQSVASVHTAQAAADSASWLWGALQGDFNKSPTTGQVITGGLISLIPVVDQVCDVRDIIANGLDLSDEEARKDHEKWISLALSCIGFIPEIGSAVKTVAKVALKKGVRLLELLKHMEWVEKNFRRLKIACPWGYAPIEWLRRFDWIGHARKAAGYAKKAFENALLKTEAAIRYAVGAVQASLRKLAELFRTVASRVVDSMQELGRRIKTQVDELLGRARKEAGNYDAAPGGPNKHSQRDSSPPPDKRSRSKFIRVQTERNSAFFWSGRTNGVGGEKIAAEIAEARGGKTLEMLIEERGIKMPKWDPSDVKSIKAWEDISAEYAAGVSGEVRAVVGESLRSESIWLRRELPALRSNPNVTKITVIDPSTLAEKIIFAR